MMHGAPLGLVVLFQMDWLNHFIQHANSSQEQKSCLSLITMKATYLLKLAKDNGITDVSLLSLVLIRSTYYNTAANEWMLSHPSTPITIYNVAEVAGKAYSLAFNLVSVCQESGLLMKTYLVMTNI
ncbi:hypothetical protein NQ315_015159 [Exocentrus adspersus]|uniref:Uncharacterized protein n=1 Tax=Exocentrus adspersus TaxID=1586481 RepID=A0AAV8VEI6_9CUCU|nr:hypothetical protein NQ315_015159 [Exocentrus adspersus]